MIEWNALESVQDLDQLLELSREKPDSLFAVFKHSTACVVSSLAKSNLEKKWKKHNHDVPIYLLDILQYRNVSNYIEEELEITHQSPQLIILKAGEVVHHASHSAINARLPVEQQ